VTHTCNPSYSGDGYQKVSESLMAHTCNLATWEAEIGRISVTGQPKQVRDPISKITRAKWTGGSAQRIEHLLCKCEAFDFKPQSNPPAKKKRNPISTNKLGMVVCNRNPS
jgi:hypothetical protein